MKALMKKIAAYVFVKHIVPLLRAQLDKFAAAVVNSKDNTVNIMDVNDVTRLAEKHFIDNLFDEEEF